MKSVAVYCGSSPGRRASYANAARMLGAEMARRGITLVYGGASVGLMGIVADAALAGGGTVVGVIPGALERKEVAHRGLSELVVVDTMHARKAEMSLRADAFIAMPGGFGTMDELFEAISWNQLGIHAKPCGLLDVAGFWQPLMLWIAHAEAEGLLRTPSAGVVFSDPDPIALLDRLSAALLIA